MPPAVFVAMGMGTTMAAIASAVTTVAIAAAPMIQGADAARKSKHSAEAGQTVALQKEEADKKRRIGAAKASVGSRGFIGEQDNPNDILGNIVNQIKTGSDYNTQLINTRADTAISEADAASTANLIEGGKGFIGLIPTDPSSYDAGGETTFINPPANAEIIG